MVEKNERFEDWKNVSYKDYRQITIDRVIKMMMEQDPRDALEFICSFPDLFEISKPVQKDGKFVYTVTIRER